MTTTTIRLEDDLKARVAAAAEKAGKTAHAFILEAISQTVEQAGNSVVYRKNSTLGRYQSLS
jgi:predicted transcriptional regulator